MGSLEALPAGEASSGKCGADLASGETVLKAPTVAVHEWTSSMLAFAIDDFRDKRIDTCVSSRQKFANNTWFADFRALYT